MKKLNLSLFILLVVTTQAVAGEFVVKHKSGASITSLGGKNNSLYSILNTHETGQLIKISIKDSDEERVILNLLQNSDVEYVVKNFQFKALEGPFKPSGLREQWALTKVNAEKAWVKATSKGSRKVVVAVIDTGVDYKHESLKENMVPGYNFVNNNNDPMDIPYKDIMGENPGHGTHCAGIIGATGLVTNGVIGMSPEVSIMPLRFFNEKGDGDLMDSIKAIDYAIENKADIISASWGAAVSRSQAKPLLEAIQRAEAAGIIFVVAASNEGKSNDTYSVFPANAGFSNVLSIAASDQNDKKPKFSNYGKFSVDIAAPGVDIMSTVASTDKYKNLSGTSMATPLVAGLIALLKSKDERLNGVRAKALLQASGAKVDIVTACDCRIDAAEAMDQLLKKTPLVIPQAIALEPKQNQTFTIDNGTAPFSFSSSNPNVAQISDTGVLTALTEGETTVSIVDANGQKASSRLVRIASRTSGGGGDGGGGGGGGNGECPLGSKPLCDGACKFVPDLPWCQK